MTETVKMRQRQEPPAAVRGPQMQPAQDCLAYLREYARQRPDVAALWCFGIGFVLGWKLKPW
jgi:hypothetical protein